MSQHQGNDAATESQVTVQVCTLQRLTVFAKYNRSAMMVNKNQAFAKPKPKKKRTRFSSSVSFKKCSPSLSVVLALQVML